MPATSESKKPDSPKRETETPESETEEFLETMSEELDFRTMAFIKEHVDFADLSDFYPEEDLNEIKEVTSQVAPEKQSAQRILAYKDFRRKLKTFRENMSKGQLELENFIKLNPDSSLDQLEATVYQITEKYQLSSQISRFLAAVEQYFKAHAEIAIVVGQFRNLHGVKWPEEIFAKLFGRLPHGSIQINIMPMGVYFKIYDLTDYILAFGENENMARASGGAKINRKLSIPEFNQKLMIERSDVTSESHTRITAVHEEEHTVHSLYPAAVFIQSESPVINLWNMHKEISGQMFKEALAKGGNMYIRHWQRNVKSEIPAYLKDGSPTNKIREALLNEKEGRWA